MRKKRTLTENELYEIKTQEYEKGLRDATLKSRLAAVKEGLIRRPELLSVRLRIEFKCPYCETRLEITEMNLRAECLCGKWFKIVLKDLVWEGKNRMPQAIPSVPILNVKEEKLPKKIKGEWQE